LGSPGVFFFSGFGGGGAHVLFLSFLVFSVFFFGSSLRVWLFLIFFLIKPLFGQAVAPGLTGTPVFFLSYPPVSLAPFALTVLFLSGCGLFSVQPNVFFEPPVLFFFFSV